MTDLSIRKPFPLVWDNTMRADFVTCPRMFFYEFMHHLVPDRPSVDLHCGGVFASALETTRKVFYGQRLSADHALAAGAKRLILEWGDFDPGDSVKTLESTMSAFHHYFNRWPLATDYLQPLTTPDGEPMVEFNFAQPIPEVRHPETGEPIIYCGRFDMVAKHTQLDLQVGVDEKTTKQLGATWPNKWTMRSQFTGYIWGANKHKIPLQGFVVRGLSFLKRSHGDAECLVYRPDWHIDMWYKQLVRDLERAKRCWEDNYWDFDLNESCSHYGGCSYLRLCDSPTPDDWTSYYRERVWEPLKGPNKAAE